MCGICGFVGPRDDGTLHAMTATLIHRGPDEEGYLVRPEVSLGVRRLAIIDPAHGHQPMTSEDGRVAVVFNGEIYNAARLRAELRARGHVFKTLCDTEVLPHLYEEYGDAFAMHLDGQFAIALWDQRTRRLVLTRDRLGIKPLHYAQVGDRFVFASELKGILRALPQTPEIDPEALRHYLTLKYVPAPLTIYSGVRAVLPGVQVVYQNGRVGARSYWSLEDAGRSQTAHGSADHLDMLLMRAVRNRLIADVPVGIMLSGGLDSSLLLALAGEAGAQRLHTFTLGYREDFAHKQADVHAARRMAREFGTTHHEHLLSADEFAAGLPDALRAFDQPFAGVISPYFLCRLIARHVKVCLSGDGADELFGSYLAHRLAQPIHNVRTYGEAAVRVRPELLGPCADDMDRVIRLARQRDWEWRAALGVFSDAEKHDLLNPDFAGPEGDGTADWYRAALAACPHQDAQNRQQHLDCRTLLPDVVLAFNDRLAMAHSVETRVPFLDHAVVEFVSGLPGNVKIQGACCKWLLKEVARRRLPDDIVDRPKEGFVPPVNEWQRRAFRPLIEDTLRAPRLAAHGYFRPDVVSALVQRYYAGETDLQYKVWALLCFQVWYEQVAVRRPAAVPAEAGSLETCPAEVA